MRKIIFSLAAATLVLLSCEKKGNEKNENLCPVVLASAVPMAVKDSFEIRYPATLVTTWFYKDSSSYCAAFTSIGIEKLAQFAINGAFIKEAVENHHDGDHDDDDSTTTSGVKVVNSGCECELPDNHD